MEVAQSTSLSRFSRSSSIRESSGFVGWHRLKGKALAGTGVRKCMAGLSFGSLVEGDRVGF